MLESESVLLQRFAATGDPEAFSEIVRRYAGMVYGASLRVLSDADQAADATQETFFQLLQNASEITGSVSGWLHRVATHKAVDVIRRDSSRRKREAHYAADRMINAEKWQDISPYVDEAMASALIPHGMQNRHLQGAIFHVNIVKLLFF
jgi:DNA-directed RNA polymerase specialized sigma24 family protein